MFCEECDNSEAIFHFMEISDKSQKEMHLCMNCAKNINIISDSDDHSLSFTTMFPFLNDESVENETSGTCPVCGLKGIDLAWHGRPGCPSCYKYFKTIIDKLGKENTTTTGYSGKRPVNFIEIMTDDDPVNNHYYESLNSAAELEDELKRAVFEERYEDAAGLRDRIKEVKAIG